jgi:hypothetical protein
MAGKKMASFQGYATYLLVTFDEVRLSNVTNSTITLINPGLAPLSLPNRGGESSISRFLVLFPSPERVPLAPGHHTLGVPGRWLGAGHGHKLLPHQGLAH